jgi:hypothetical protein
MVMPGDNVSITVKLINPIAMEEGLRFAIREGGDRRRRRRGQDHGVKGSRGIAQLAERRSPKPKVVGSIPTAPAT